MDKQERNRSGFAFLFGIAAGAAAGYWLNSNQGRQWRRDTSSKLEETGSQLQEKARQQVEHVKEGFNSALESGREYAGNIESTIKEKISRGSKEIDRNFSQVENAFEEGVRRARQRLQEEASRIEN